ncbi:MAG TPA: DUF3829 domain-containing protein [Alphaproteobacteria bacterium]|nr:DUF3829 domain-containing protein [Alphaproteobacteria bacterium]
MLKSFRPLTFALVATIVWLGVGCGFLRGSARANDADDEALERKLTPIIDCINGSDKNLQEAFQEYGRLLNDIKKNPSESSASFKMGFENIDRGHKMSLECASDFEMIAKQSPKIDDIDRMTAEYAATIRAFAPLSIQADAYYRQQGYRNDSWAKGKALDDQLAPLIAKLEGLSADIHKAGEREANGIHDRALATIEAHEGKGFAWHTLHYMIEARKTLDAIEAMAESGTISRDKVGSAVAPLQAAFEDASAYASAHADEAKVKSGAKLPGWIWISATAGYYLKQANDLRVKLDEKNSPANLETNFQSLVVSYNGLVDAYNNYEAQE